MCWSPHGARVMTPPEVRAHFVSGRNPLMTFYREAGTVCQPVEHEVASPG